MRLQRLGDMTLDLKGAVELEPQLAARGFRLNAGGPRLSDIGTVANWQLKAVPFEFSTSMQGQADKLFVEYIFLRAGESELTGRVALDVTGKPNVQLALQSELINLDAIGTRLVSGEDDEGAVETDTTEDSGRLFSADPLPFEKLQDFDATVDVQIGDLTSRQRRFRNIVMEAYVLDGAIEAPRVNIDAAKGRVRSSFSVHPGPEGMNLDAGLRAQQAVLTLDGMTEEEVQALPVFAIDAKLSATGNSPQQLAATLDGYAFAVGGTGSIRKLNLGPLMGDFLTELFDTVNPFAKKEPISIIHCSGLYLEIESGKVRTSPGFVIQTDKLTVLAVGKMDLKTEEIEVTFETSPRKGLGFSLTDVINPFVMVTGTLTQPAISLDPESTLVKGGTAVATMGLSIVGKSLWKRWIASRTPVSKSAKGRWRRVLSAILATCRTGSFSLKAVKNNRALGLSNL